MMMMMLPTTTTTAMVRKKLARTVGRGQGARRGILSSPSLSSGGRQAVAAAAASACQVRVDDIIIQCELTMGA